MSVVPVRTQVALPAGDAALEGDLVVPDGAPGIVVFAHGSGSSRHSPRNRRVADTLNEAGIGTLLVDLLTAAEEAVDRVTAQHRFDIALLAHRLTAAVHWLRQSAAPELGIGLFGASTGAAAALIAARAAQGRRRGRSTATTASAMAPTSIRPKTAAAIARDASAPPGSAKTSASTPVASRMPASSHGKPRRRRP